MIFCAFYDQNDNAARWKRAMHQFAQSLEMTTYFVARDIRGGGVVHFGWLAPQPAVATLGFTEEERRVRLTTTGASRSLTRSASPPGRGGNQPKEQRSPVASANDICIDICLDTAEINIAVPPATPEQFYYTQNSVGYMVSNDLRLLMRWVGGEIDEAALYALFQYQAIPAPLSLVKQVRRVPNGHRLQLGSNGSCRTLQINFQPLVEAHPVATSDAIAQVEETLNALLTAVPPTSILYFSGGVDSALMAAQLAASERRDVVLFHYSFGPQDSESQLAAKIATQLGLPYHQVEYQPTDLPAMLTRIGRDYSFPFGDRSVIPTNLLVHASLAGVPVGTTMIDGTGADGAFGIWSTSSAVALLPAPFCRLIDQFYRRSQLWQSSHHLEERFRRARQSLQMTMPHLAVMGECAFDGIAYTIPTPMREQIERAVQDNIEVLSSGLDEEGQYSLLDLIHVCAGRFAAKTFEPLRLRGMKPFYPFLEPAMLQRSLTLPYATKCPDHQSKALLKQLLARSLPREWIYRPKHGFVPPFHTMLVDRQMQELIGEVVLATSNPLLGFCDKPMIRKLFGTACQRKAPNPAVQGFLWNFIFVSSWLQQQQG